jgi:hypothetical protein
MTPEERRLEIDVLRAAAVLYDYQTEVQAGRGYWPDGEPLPGVQLRWATEALANYHGSTTHLHADLDEEEHYISSEDQPAWILRTWADVRRGDKVRLPGTEYIAGIKDRLEAVQDDSAGRSWHVVPAPKHWDDHAVRPGECWVVFLGETEPRNMDPAKPVEILLTPAEVQAIEVIGWENRVELRHDP